MKAEHRRELHTNALADGMGRLVQRLKSKPEKSSVWLWLLVIGAIFAVVVFVFWQRSRRTQASNLWNDAAYLNARTLQELQTSFPNTNPGYSARYQVAFLLLWDRGIKNLAANPINASKDIEMSQNEYNKLAEELKDSFPTLASEALYNSAVAEEAFAAFDLDYLDRAAAAYQRVAEKFPETAHGKQAKTRVEQLKKDSPTRMHIEDFYGGMYGQIAHMRPPGGDAGKQLQELKDWLKSKK